jgi:hypothetical protein
LDQRDRSVAVRATFRVRPIGLLVGAVLLVGELALVMSLLLNGFLLPVGWWDRWLPPAINLGAGGLVLLRGVIGTGRRAPWVITGVGLLCSAMGDLYYSIALFGRYDMHSPTLADGLWLGAYLFYYAGLVLLVRAGTREFHPSMWLDGFVAGLGVAALGALAFGPLTDDAEPGWLLITLLAYPAADLLLVSLMVGVLAARGWQWSGPWIPLALGCTVNAVADIGVLVLAAEGSEAYGAVVDAMWSAAFLLLAVAAWRDRGVDRPVRLTGGRVLVVPVLVTLASLLVLLGDVVGRCRWPRSCWRPVRSAACWCGPR